MTDDLDDSLIFADESEEDLGEAAGQAPWKLLVVDDDEGIHQVTKLALDGFSLDGRELDLLKATGLESARKVMADNPDVAVVLLDVVMGDGSGLDLVGYIREELNNRLVRIILRTGQPGDAPARQVIIDYDLNDYWEKTELTAQRLFTTIATALRSYRDMQTIATLNAELEQNINQLEEFTKQLQAEIEQRKRAETMMEEAQQSALKTAQAASKAEFATSVLHNIGNVLNSVGVATGTIEETISDSNLGKLSKATNLLAENMGKPEFFVPEGKGGKLLSFLESLSTLLGGEQDTIGVEADNIRKKLALMKTIIADQQTSAKNDLKAYTLGLGEALGEALSVVEPHMKEHGAQLDYVYEGSHVVMGNKGQLTHVLINIFKNATEAMRQCPERLLSIRVLDDIEQRVTVRVKDSGEGIAPEDLSSMFTRGFTTKEEGHGFGLHYCAQVIKEMGGILSCESEGRGKGAVFLIQLRCP